MTQKLSNWHAFHWENFINIIFAEPTNRTHIKLILYEALSPVTERRKKKKKLFVVKCVHLLLPDNQEVSYKNLNK